MGTWAKLCLGELVLGELVLGRADWRLGELVLRLVGIRASWCLGELDLGELVLRRVDALACWHLSELLLWASRHLGELVLG